MMNKKGDLSLSITAIVVIVIAFVVLGLGLSLTRTIFKGAEQKLPEAFAVTQLEAEPTSQNPITIQDTVEIDRNKQKTLKIGYYNRQAKTAENAQFTLINCLNNAGQDATPLPSVASPVETVSASDAKGFSLIIKENKLEAGTYICTIGVCKNTGVNTDCTGDNLYESKQFFLQVIA